MQNVQWTCALSAYPFFLFPPDSKLNDTCTLFLSRVSLSALPNKGLVESDEKKQVRDLLRNSSNIGVGRGFKSAPKFLNIVCTHIRTHIQTHAHTQSGLGPLLKWNSGLARVVQVCHQRNINAGTYWWGQIPTTNRRRQPAHSKHQGTLIFSIKCYSFFYRRVTIS